MDNTFSIATLNNDSCDQIISLILPIQQIEFSVPVTLAQQPDLLDIEKNYHQTGGHFWGVKHDGLLVGTIGLIAIDNYAGVIRKMFVRKEYRGKEFGTAQLLLNHLLTYCRQNQITDIYLGTFDALRAAQRFYERNGFNKLAKEDLPGSFPVMGVDNLFYHLNLADQQQLRP